jgi:hypothetical protein
MAAKHNPLLRKDNWSSVCIHFKNFNLHPFEKVDATGLKIMVSSSSSIISPAY